MRREDKETIAKTIWEYLLSYYGAALTGGTEDDTSSAEEEVRCKGSTYKDLENKVVKGGNKTQEGFAIVQ